MTEPPVFWKDANQFVTEAESWPRMTRLTSRPGRRMKITARPEFRNTYRHIEATRSPSHSNYNNDLGENFVSSDRSSVTYSVRQKLSLIQSLSLREVEISKCILL